MGLGHLCLMEENLSLVIHILFKSKNSNDKILFCNNLLHVYFVYFTVGIAAMVPHLDLLISLIGAFASCALALMLPPIIELLTLSVEQGQLPWWKVLKDILIIVFGLIGFIIGTWTSLQEIIKTF